MDPLQGSVYNFGVYLTCMPHRFMASRFKIYSDICNLISDISNSISEISNSFSDRPISNSISGICIRDSGIWNSFSDTSISNSLICRYHYLQISEIELQISLNELEISKIELEISEIELEMSLIPLLFLIRFIHMGYDVIIAPTHFYVTFCIRYQYYFHVWHKEMETPNHVWRINHHRLLMCYYNLHAICSVVYKYLL